MLTRFASLHPEIVAGGGAVVAVAPAAPYQARHLASTTPYPLLLDRDEAITRRLRFRRRTLGEFLFDLRAWGRWLRALLRHRRQGRITGHHGAVPGVVIVDGTGDVVWVHEGTGIGDYPPPEEILAALDRLLGDGTGT